MVKEGIPLENWKTLNGGRRLRQQSSQGDVH